MSQWLFDLGNTRLKFAELRADGSLGEVTALPHTALALADGLQSRLPENAGSACIASVASPSLRGLLVDTLSMRFKRMSFARSVPHLAGVRIAYQDPSKLGVDRFLALLAARARGPRPWLVAGIGTALTLDLLDAHGRHQGGRIAPAPELMRQALHRAAMQLPAEGGGYVEFAADTSDALASGCEGMALGLIQRSLRMGGEQVGTPPGLLLHGGGAEALRAHFPDAIHAPWLVLEGLAQWSRAGSAA